MLKAYGCGADRLVEMGPHAAGGAEAVWYDLVCPTPEESALVAHITGLRLPERAEIEEIENSSRLAVTGEVLTLSMPVVVRSSDGFSAGACGFVLAPGHLVTIRFASHPVFDNFATLPHATGRPESAHSAFIFVGLLEAFADRQADTLEMMKAELDGLSHRVFHHGMQEKPGGRRPNEEESLRRMLIILGITYDNISFFRDSQLGIARIAPYVAITASAWLPKPVDKRLKTLATDIASLNEFSTHLSDKVQFLLDATLGLINIAQSSLMKLFTIVSVVGIPPTLIAGIYGMNFHNMPELSWTYGYQYGWAMIILSAVLPLLWFRLKGWL